MFHRIRISALSLLLLLASGPMLSANAQPTPSAGPPATLQVAFPVEELPSPEAEVRFLRYTFDPGAQLPAAPQMGSTLLVVESGEITLTTDQPVSVKNGGQVATPSPAQSDASDTTLRPTEGALIPDGTLMSARNDSDQEAQLLVLLVFSREQEMSVDGADGSPTAQPSGVNIQQISSGHVTFPAWSGVLLIEREIMGISRSAASSTHNGIEAGALEQGSAQVMVMTGSTSLQPGVLNIPDDATPAEPVEVDLRSMIDLTAGDVYSSLGSSLVWRSTGEEPLVLLRAVVVPIAP